MRIFLTDYRTAWSDNVKLIGDIKFPQFVNVFEDSYKRVASGLVYPPHKVAEKVLDPLLCDQLRQSDCKTAFILAGGNAHFAGLLNKQHSNSLSYQYKFLPFSLTQVYAGRIAQSLNAHGQITTDATACASSLKVMMDVQNLIWIYKFDRVIVLSTEDGVSNPVLEFFGESQASLSYKEEMAGVKPSAFDDFNYGFRVAQGAVLAVFESERWAEKSSRSPKAELLGAYTASENCSNSIGQLENGQGFVNAIAGALEISNLNEKSISLVKTHGTGTKSNNLSESTALGRILTKFVATSYKPKIGHTMGASGLLESCLLFDSIKSGVIPKIENRTKQDKIYLSQDLETNGETVLSLAAGMGNVYSAAIFNTRGL